MLVYKRLMDIHDKMPMIDHALAFLRACMIRGWRVTVMTFIPSNKFFGMVHSAARLWAKNRFAAVSPFCPARQQHQQQHQQMLQAPQGQVAQVQALTGPGN